jgi:uncharacterized HhH-GPD family protein
VELPIVTDAIILGCVSTKLAGPTRAKDLYASPLWMKRRRYAESTGKPWFIFSARHGIIEPDSMIEWYDVAMSRLSSDEIKRVGEQASEQLSALVGDLNGRRFEIHAGASYVRALKPALARRGASLDQPLEGLTFGRQLHWYNEHAGVQKAQPEPSPPVAQPNLQRWPSAATTGDLGTVSIDDVQPVGDFDFRWPTEHEHFDYGWDFKATDSLGRLWRLRHGLGGRDVYGRFRRHSVTWLEGQPMVEGVAADDYEFSAALLSLIRLGGKAHVRDVDELPVGYAGFEVVRQQDEIKAKWVPASLSVKLFEDDLEGWARHAILRGLSKETPTPSPQRRLRPTQSPILPAAPVADRGAVAQAILAYGASHSAEQGDRRTEFTPNPEANALLYDDPFAFLLAVIFDQGIVAERAWAAPYELKRRLGHLDPYQIAHEPDAVSIAVATPPKLQRFVNTVPRWVVAAARIVTDHYAGEARRIWADRPSAATLMARLDAFPGIGQKKSAMAVEMLVRDLGVAVADLHQSDIAFDVHVRRVMLRTGLAERDDQQHMVDVARAVHPDRPGELDLPMWLIGRSWCRPGVPLCAECPLFGVCPRLISQAGAVAGA